jgi:L-ornithine N5-oxygenase
MQSREPDIYDVVGIGFGPSNLALAIALEEYGREDGGQPLKAMFVERQPSLGWHRGMLVPGAKMQVSFLKDLATFRNPVSRFSFISYLHAKGRLAKFVNNQDFFPTRQEFHDYLDWAESRISSSVSYGTNVTAIQLPECRLRDGSADFVQIEMCDSVTQETKSIGARNVVVSTGLVPRMPAGVEPDANVWHSEEFLHRFRECDPSDLKRVAVVGAGQSAAEIVRFAYDMLPEATVSAILPAYGYSIADDTPFANQIFDPEAVQDYFAGSDLAKEAIWKYHKNTNYSVVDSGVIKDVYRRYYDDELHGSPRLSFLNLSRVVGAKRVGSDTRVTVNSLVDKASYELDFDVLICATGYDPMEPSDLLSGIDNYCARDAQGGYRIGRDYRIVTDGSLQCGIYAQGGTEHSHGLSSSLLSNIAVRSGEILGSILDRRRLLQGRRATAPNEDGEATVKLHVG